MTNKILTGTLLDDHIELSLNDLCKACSSSADWILELVDYGAIDPIGAEKLHWRFSAQSLQRARTAKRLQRDLEINIAGVVLALDLLDEIKFLRNRLNRRSLTVDK